MMFLKVLSVLLLGLDAYLGIRFLLNVLNVLQTSKYSPAATFLYAVVFLGLAIAGFYFLFVKNDLKISLWISVTPWLVIVVVLFFSLIFGNYN